MHIYYLAHVWKSIKIKRKWNTPQIICVTLHHLQYIKFAAVTNAIFCSETQMCGYIATYSILFSCWTLPFCIVSVMTGHGSQAQLTISAKSADPNPKPAYINWWLRWILSMHLNGKSHRSHVKNRLVAKWLKCTLWQKSGFVFGPRFGTRDCKQDRQRYPKTQSKMAGSRQNGSWSGLTRTRTSVIVLGRDMKDKKLATRQWETGGRHCSVKSIIISHTCRMLCRYNE